MAMSSDFYTKDQPGNQHYDIGGHTYGKPKIYDWKDGTKLSIGKYCSIADDVVILLGGNHRVDWLTTYPFPAVEGWPEAMEIKGHPASKGDIVIENDVWIGYGATILSGVKIGNGAVVGARAVVTKDVPPYAIVAGNPAKIIKLRFSKREIKALLNLSWWNWSEEKIRAEVQHLCSADIRSFIDKNRKGAM
jgi:acetyltransferase-like isoleucine patch superfamily enzyme